MMMMTFLFIYFVRRLLSIVGFYDNKITENLSLHSLFWMLLGWVFLAIVARRGIRFVIKVSEKHKYLYALQWMSWSVGMR